MNQVLDAQRSADPLPSDDIIKRIVSEMPSADAIATDDATVRKTVRGAISEVMTMQESLTALVGVMLDESDPKTFAPLEAMSACLQRMERAVDLMDNSTFKWSCPQHLPEAAAMPTAIKRPEMTRGDTTSAPSVSDLDADRELAAARRRIADLEGAISDMASMSSSVCDRIGSLAKMALSFMESPEAYRHPQVLADAFEQVVYSMEEADNYLNTRSEDVGQNYVDKRRMARVEAQQQAERRGHAAFNDGAELAAKG